MFYQINSLPEGRWNEVATRQYLIALLSICNYYLFIAIYYFISTNKAYGNYMYWLLITVSPNVSCTSFLFKERYQIQPICSSISNCKEMSSLFWSEQ